MSLFNQSSGKVVSGMKHVGTAATGMASSFKQVGAASTSLGQSTKHVDRLTTSLKLMSRIVVTQAVVRLLSSLRNAYRGAFDDAVKFENQIGRIQTIAGGAGFDKLANSVREISDAYNLTLDSTGAGVYQALSNQVGNLGETLDFTGKAAEFARATGSSLSASVDLLSSAIKSYGLEASDTDRVAGVFFTTLERGRVKASELSNAFGRVSTISADLGISLEEIGGSLASITVRGSRSAEALTQFRGILVGLIKPSEKMSETLRNLGFTSARSAIQTLGFAGVLDALTKSTGGSAEQLSKLFPNVRGLSGVASLASDDLLSLTSNIREMESASRDFSKDKFLTATATDAERATKEINKLKNAITVDLGRALVAGTGRTLEFVGGADTLINVTNIAIPTLGGLAATLLAVQANAILARNGVNSLARGVGLLAAVPLASGLGDSIGTAYRQNYVSNLTEQTRALEVEHQKQLEDFTRMLGSQRDEQAKADKERLRAVGELTRQMNLSYISVADDARVSNDQMVRSTKASLDEIISARQQSIQELTRAVDDSANVVKSSQQRVADLLTSREGRQFAGSIAGFDDPIKAMRLAERAQQIAAQAGQELSQAVEPEQIQAALKGFDRARRLAEQAGSAASGNRASEQRAAQALEAITDRQIEAERSMNSAVEARLPSLTDSRREHERILELLRKQVQIVSENVSVFDGIALLGDADLAKRLDRRNQALSEIASLTGVELKVNTDSIVDQVRSAFDRSSFSALEPFGTFGDPDEVNRTMDSMTRRSQQITAELDKQAKLDRQRQQINEQIVSLFGSLDSAMEGQNLRGATNRYESLRANMERARDAASRIPQDAKQAQAIVDQLNQTIDEMASFTFTPIGMGGIAARGAATDILTQISRELAQAGALEVNYSTADLEGELNRINSVLSSAENNMLQVGQATAAAKQQASQWANEMERGARAQAGGGPAVGRMFGGPINYRAAGGMARGTDNIPAMLSPGEFVVNARNANRFRTQLQAMNAGIAPTYRSEGGSVNVTVGDVNVTGGPSGVQTGREIANTLKREMRRGTSRL